MKSCACGSDRIILMSIGDGEFVVTCEYGHPIILPEGDTLTARLVAEDESEPMPEPEPATYTPSQLRQETERSRRRSLASARSSELGHTVQQIFPFAEAHGYHPRDIQYIGGTMDYLVLDGLTALRHEGRDADPTSLSVVLAEVKSGRSKSSRVQRYVVQAMNEGRTRGEIWTATESGGELTWSLVGTVLKPR